MRDALLGLADVPFYLLERRHARAGRPGAVSGVSAAFTRQALALLDGADRR
jgi:hypothetical protein